MARMIKKIIYIISIISLGVLTILTSQMIPIIFQANLQGIFYLITVIGLLIFELIELIISKKIIKKMYGYNIMIILISIYLSIIYCVIYSNNSLNSIKYYKDNFLIVSILIILTIISYFFIKNDFKSQSENRRKIYFFPLSLLFFK